MTSPAACPASGCAAGQRLNFGVEFTVNPQFTSGPNTQVCIYAPADGQQGTGSNSWADFSQGWIAGGTSTPVFTPGEQGSVCSTAAPAGSLLLTSAYAQYNTAQTGQVHLAFNIRRTTDIAGEVSAKIFQVASDGTSWTLSSSTSGAFTVSVPVAAVSQTAYTAELPAACGSFSPCYVHSGDDKEHGLGTGLYDAIQALDPGGKIFILRDQRLKSYPVRINKYLVIRGYNAESMLTSINSDAGCSRSLLLYQSAGVLRDLTLNDGNCPASNSRTLVEVDSSNLVTIRNNTINSGAIGVLVRNQPGKVDIQFNKISNNLEYAVLVEPGSADPGRVRITGNNLLDNGSDIQVNCNAGGTADHNFWGEGSLPSENAANCILSDGKRLGAPILSSSNGHGVQAVLGTVKGTYTYFFDGKIGVRHSTGDDFNVVIINHGQGTQSNIPFFESGSGEINPCSSFFDVFLAADADPKNLEVALKYDLNEYCTDIIESDFYCGSETQERFPLWWYDPVNNVTDGWDLTGQAPNGPGSGGALGQTTICDTQQNQIVVKIDNTGRPGLLSDLTFTPFTTGFIEGAALTDFKVEFINFYSKISWQTAREKNISKYIILKSESTEGPYKTITEVDVDGDSTSTTSYQFYDYDVTLSKSYYYQLQVIHSGTEKETIGLHGPITLQVPGPTITNTPTVTRTPYPTSTPIYRTPTRAYYRSATPGNPPTPVRTFGPSPTGPTKPPYNPSPSSTITPLPGYPIEFTATATQSGYPIVEDPTPTPTFSGSLISITPEIEGTKTPDSDQGQQDNVDNPAQPQWTHLLIGIASGLIVLFGLSLLLSKIYFR